MLLPLLLLRRHMLRCRRRQSVESRLRLLLHVLRWVLLIPGMLLWLLLRRTNRSRLRSRRSRRALLSRMCWMLLVYLLRVWWRLPHRRRRGLLGLLTGMRIMLWVDICREALVR